MVDIFISYKREDREYAKKIAFSLEKMGYKVWWDFNLIGGQQYIKETNLMLQQSKVVIVLWTPEAIESRWVIGEVDVGLSQDKLIPIKLHQDIDIPAPYNVFQTIDFSSFFNDPSDEVNLDNIQSLVLAINLKLNGNEINITPVSGTELELSKKKKEDDIEFWKSIHAKRKPQTIDYESYLNIFKDNGIFNSLARKKIKKLNRALRAAYLLITIVLIATSCILYNKVALLCSDDDCQKISLCFGNSCLLGNLTADTNDSALDTEENITQENTTIKLPDIRIDGVERDIANNVVGDQVNPSSQTRRSELSYDEIKQGTVIYLKAKEGNYSIQTYDNYPKKNWWRKIIWGKKLHKIKLPIKTKVIEKHTTTFGYKWLKAQYTDGDSVIDIWFSWGTTNFETYEILVN